MKTLFPKYTGTGAFSLNDATIIPEFTRELLPNGAENPYLAIFRYKFQDTKDTSYFSVCSLSSILEEISKEYPGKKLDFYKMVHSGKSLELRILVVK